jgi:hypothetical protein
MFNISTSIPWSNYEVDSITLVENSIGNRIIHNISSLIKVKLRQSELT